MLRMRKGVIIKIRNSRTFKGLAVCLLLNLVAEIVQPTVSLALTDGPSQPEVRSFEPIGTTQMVDLFSGDFNYNIPLFNLPGPNGGYPVNIAYHAGIGMDDEASWVGLGWNINPGSLVRNMRGLPDEFLSTGSNEEADIDHDYLEVKSDIKQSWTLGMSVGLGASVEVLGGQLDLGGLNFALYYNNYKGMGVTIGKGFSGNGNFSLGISLDSENGLGVSASLSHQNELNQIKSTYKLGVNFNGDLSVNYSLSRNKYEENCRDVVEINRETGNLDVIGSESSKTSLGGNTYSGSYSFAANQFAPSVGRRMNNYNLSASIAFDAQASVLAGELASLGVFYQTQDINDSDKNGRRIPVVGYDNFGKENSEHYTRDFTRQNDGQLTKSSVMLSNSYYTNDAYLSTGQGLMGFFRARRNDIGKVFDPYVHNTSAGLSLGFDVGAGGLIKLGGNFGVNFGWDTQGAWNTNNSVNDDFLNPSLEGINENLYYQAHGEQTILNSDLGYMNGLELATIKLEPKGSDGVAGGHRTISNASFNNDEHDNSTRFVRNTLIHTLPNKSVSNLGEFNIKYYNSANPDLKIDPSVSLNRTVRGTVKIDNHKAGFKVLNEEGSYYVYGLPAYNKKEVENLFSVKEPQNPGNVNDVEIDLNGSEVDYKVTGSKSHKFINKSTKSPYTHSFLLTSVQGADYVDITNDGPTNDDLGYWVKFDYKQVDSDFKWRAPYFNDKAKYHRNASYTSSDDKASYQYGEKEIWNLARIETKSHIAIFITSTREDGKEADGELDNGSSGGTHGVKLEAIEIYEKSDFTSNSVPIQKILFEYHDPADELCQDTDNSTSATKGKLTLKSISFNSMGSTRGDLSKYEFGYAGQSGMGGINPDYRQYSYDGWGVYRFFPSVSDPNDVDLYEHFPYVNQFQQSFHPELDNLYSTGYTAQQIQDDFASAWCLKQIKLPSGGTINIDYESDDYAYVQHKVANQMFEIFSLSDLEKPSQVYTKEFDNYYDTSDDADENARRIYFRLETPLQSVSDVVDANKIYNEYVKPITKDESGNRNLYFKSRMKLTSSPDVYDYVSGYLPIENSLIAYQNTYNFGLADEEIFSENGIDYHPIGYITIQATQKKNGGYFEKYHPMALAAWTYMQTNAQDLLNNPNSFDSESDSNSDPIGQIGDIINVIPMLMSSFGGIRTYCRSKFMAQHIDLNKSCIRLASPDKKKFGGGHRVKQIAISDNWNSDTEGAESNRTYGLAYDYTTTDENGNVISSGVASYEPQAIGDENALKYPIYFYGKASIFTSNNLFAEYPVNQDLFPGASVGYSKVTSKSINTNSQLKNVSPRGRTSGITVNEFFTARDFPTFVSWTNLSEVNNTMDVFNVPIPLPFIGVIKRTYFHGTQAFLIETNDMHGKMKSVKTYEVNIASNNTYSVNSHPITESVIEYQCIPTVYQGENVWKLDNNVAVIPNDNSHTVATVKRLMGVEVDLFTDQRESKGFSQTLGADLNVDVPMLPAILPTVWPSFTNVKSMTRTYTTNKIVHRTGIVKKTKSRDLQTVNESEVLAYDEKSGVPMLTKVKNEFGDDFYSYNIPAYYHYDRMGHAYRNIGFNFVTTVPEISVIPWKGSQNQVFIEIPASGLENYLIRGDELLMVSESNESAVNNNRKAYFIGWGYSGGQTVAKIHIINAVNDESERDYRFEVIRSGRRNHYSNMAASYLTKGKLNELLAENSETLSGSITTPVIEDGVLSASASLFKDDWSTSSLEVGFDLSVDNPFLEGNSGIWRPYKSYSYVGERKGNANMIDNQIETENPKLFEDGIMENVPMFSYEIGSMENYVSNWEWVNEVTRFSGDSYELENSNRLDINSSALYGYDNSLTIGVGGNADMHEIGVADFETISLTEFSRQLIQTNLNFDNNHAAGTLFVTKKYNVVSAVPFNAGVGTANMNVLTDMPYSLFEQIGNSEGGSNELSTTCGLELISIKTGVGPTNEGYYFNGFLRGDVTNVNGFASFQLKIYLEDAFDPFHLLKLGTDHYGKITFLMQRNFIAGPSVSYVNEKSHTGKKSMKVDSDVVFDQPKLVLKPNKKYVVSMWMSRANTKVANYHPENLVKIGTMDGSTFNEVAPSKVTMSKIVEGWQKIDLEFSINAPLPKFAVKFLPGASSLFVDDIRVSPKTGGMTTYVYDVKNYRLVASMNVDNYATLFYYDEEGNLTIKKQETEKGIFTIAESRGHVSEN